MTLLLISQSLVLCVRTLYSLYSIFYSSYSSGWIVRIHLAVNQGNLIHLDTSTSYHCGTGEEQCGEDKYCPLEWLSRIFPIEQEVNGGDVDTKVDAYVIRIDERCIKQMGRKISLPYNIEPIYPPTKLVCIFTRSA